MLKPFAEGEYIGTCVGRAMKRAQLWTIPVIRTLGTYCSDSITVSLFSRVIPALHSAPPVLFHHIYQTDSNDETLGEEHRNSSSCRSQTSVSFV